MGNRVTGWLAVAALVGLLGVAGLVIPVGPVVPADAPGGDRTGERVYFAASDPAGDDRGAGSLVYPTHRAFEPHRGLFDLLAFRVLGDGTHIHFDLTFGEITNPFSAPEGFYHQRIDIYIAAGGAEGSLEPFVPGPHIRFHPRHPWTMRLRVAPFGGTRLHGYRDPVDSPGRGRGLETRVLPDGRTIRVSVPVEVLGVPGRDWRYYVLVGGYDHFGPDEWRDVVAEESPWAFGAGRDPAGVPRVIDMLAPGWGWRSQVRQLGRPDGPAGWAPTVYPAGPGVPWELPGALLLIVGAFGVGVWRWRRVRARAR